MNAPAGADGNRVIDTGAGGGGLDLLLLLLVA
jgi:hypothetical protein